MPKGENSFKRGNPYAMQPRSDRLLSAKPICVKPFADQYEALKAIPDLQDRLRLFFDDLIPMTYPDA